MLLTAVGCRSRSGNPTVEYRKMWLRIAKLGNLPADIASLLGHRTHSITSRYLHSVDAVLLAAAGAVANATMKLLGGKGGDRLLALDSASRVEPTGDGITSL